MKYYGKVQKMAGCGRLADWSTTTTQSAISNQTTRHETFLMQRRSRKKQIRLKPEGAKEQGDQ
jgi:hypothetical protein